MESGNSDVNVYMGKFLKAVKFSGMTVCIYYHLWKFSTHYLGNNFCSLSFPAMNSLYHYLLYGFTWKYFRVPIYSDLLLPFNSLWYHSIYKIGTTGGTLSCITRIAEVIIYKIHYTNNIIRNKTEQMWQSTNLLFLYG